MIEKKYGITGTLTYFKHKNSNHKMQNKNTTEDKIILLVNPLVIEGETNSYNLNNDNDFKKIKPLEFTLNSDKDIKH